MEKLWTYDDVSTYLGVTERTVRNWMRERSLPYLKIGKRHVRFRPDEVRAWADAQRG